MECNSLIIYYKKKTKKNKPRVFATISPAHYKEKSWWDWFEKNNWAKEEINREGYGYCTGLIVANVEAVDEPYMGGTYAELKVTYKCEKCGQTSWGDLLPTTYNISEWVTQKIKEMK